LRQQYDDVDVNLIRSGGGVFEVTVDGELIYSKRATGEHVTPAEILQILEQRSD
jgi:selenoprotein W-related protein